MLATMQRMVHKLTRSRRAPAQAKVIAKLVGMRRRYVWAQAVQHLVDSASRGASACPVSPPGMGAPLSLSTKVVKASRLELLAVKEALLDTRRPISAAAVQQRTTFLSDPTASPLSGGDPIIARRAATQLQRSVAAHPNPDPGHPVSPNANMGARR